MSPLSNLNPQFVKVVAIVLAVVALGLLVSYLAPSCQHKADVREQVKAKAQHAASVATNQQATNAYRIDSAKLAERAWLLHQRDSLLRQQDAQLSRNRGPFGLPPIGELPHEGAGR